MAETIRGIVVTIGADTTGLGKALGDVNSKSRDIQSELRQVEKLLKLDPTNTELVAQKQRLLGDAIATAAEKLKTLKAAQQQVDEQFAKGDISAGQYRAFQREVAATEQQLNGLEKQLESTKKSFDLGGALNKASDALKNVGKQLENTGNRLTKTFTVPIVAAAAGIGALVVKTSEVGDALDEMAARTGFSTEALSEYKYVAGLSGIELAGLETAVKKMQNTVTDAANGSKSAAGALAQLGVSVKSLKGLSPEQQFDKLAAAVASVVDPTRRAALAQDVFGKSGTDLLPMFAEGADGIARLRQEARDLGVVWSGESAKAASMFNDSLARLKAGVQGAYQKLAVDLIPVIVDKLLPVIEERIVPAIKRFAERIGELIGWFSELDPSVQGAIVAAIGFAAAIGPVLSVIGKLTQGIGLLTSPIGLVIVGIGLLVAAAVYLKDAWAPLGRWFGALWDLIGAAFSIGGASINIVFKELKLGLAQFFDWAIGKVADFGMGLGGLVSKIPVIGGFGKEIMAASEGLRSWANGIESAAAASLDAAKGGLYSAQEAWERSQHYLGVFGSQVADAVSNKVKGSVDDAGDSLSSLRAAASNAGDGIAAGLRPAADSIDGMNAGLDSLNSKLSGKKSAAAGDAKEAYFTAGNVLDMLMTATSAQDLIARIARERQVDLSVAEAMATPQVLEDWRKSDYSVRGGQPVINIYGGDRAEIMQAVNDALAGVTP